MKKQLVRLTESDLHNIIKESVKKILKEWEFSPEQLDDKAYMNDFYAQKDKMFQDDWEMRNRRLRQKYPGKSDEWYEAMIDTFYENKMNSKKSINETDCAGVMQTGAGNAPKGTNPEAGQYTVPLGADKETADRTPGFSVKDKAKWNKNPGNVQRRPIYNPKG